MDAAAESNVNSRTSEAAAPTRRSIRRPLTILIAVTGVVVAGVATYLLMTRGEESTDDAQVDADVVPLAPRVGGLLVKLHVVDNQAVKKGDLLLELDPADFRARVQASEAELETAQAQANVSDAQFRVVEATARGGFSSAKAAVAGSSVAVANSDAQIAAAEAVLARTEADSRKGQLDFSRAQQLLAANAITQERFDNAQTAMKSGEAQLRGAKAQLAAAEQAKRAALSRVDEARGHFEASAPIDSQIASAHAASELAHARVKGAQAQLELARLQLAYSQLSAPADGVVSKLSAHEGQLLSPGQPVAELVPLGTYVVANFKETQTANMKVGLNAEVRVDAYPGRKLEGVVESVSGGTGSRFSLLPPDNASGNFVKVVQRVPVRIAWKKVPEGMPLRAGLSTEVTVFTK